MASILSNKYKLTMQPEFIRDLIEAGLPEAQAHVEGDGAHFTAVVVTPAFNGKTRLQKQQMCMIL